MLLLTNLPKYITIPVYWKCTFFVMLRAFGLGSGCLAFVMAMERWLALTRPFVYQQYVTKIVLKRVIFSLWTFAALLTLMPLFGFGLFYEDGKCHRYREATQLRDIIYAYLFFTFGTSLCTCIAFFNTKVFYALSHIGKKQKKVLVRRISRSIIKEKKTRNLALPEELAFAKLMAFICIVFILCWMPQMVAIPLGHFFAESKLYRVLARIADVLMCVYFTLDPYIYVLHQYMEKGRFRVPFKWQRSNPATPTTEIIRPPSFSLGQMQTETV
ncbi:PREDICTED: cannabinoid receptor 1 isoform X2 [Nicrophorus vespilloides]|nr:PREDICTED: cannabinoid receptor 1 isoform X2 [Nicrophorus vespilloides]